MGVSEQVVRSLETIFPSWSFVTVDAKGRSGGLSTGWCLKSCKCDRIWGFESGLGLNMFSAELGRSLLLINIYGPYTDRNVTGIPWKRSLGFLNKMLLWVGT
jgi:hypothetical protein